MADFLDFLLHSDRHLLEFVRAYGSWVYGLLFAIVFAETGIVVMPFLPGDSLLFATGALCATGVLSTPTAMALLVLAAFTGDATNYTVGRLVGPRVFGVEHTRFPLRWLNRRHLDRAHAFFETYGGKAIVLGRFVPIVRTFVPFVAGAAEMRSHTFAIYNIVGAVAWVVLCVGAGVLFGNIPVVQRNFSLVTVAIVFISILPVIIEYLRQRRR